MSETHKQEGAGQQGSGGPAARIYKAWWFWLGVLVLLGGVILYVRTWTRALHLDFTPETNAPPPVAQPAQPLGNARTN
jgi:hypothetical protein